MKGPDVTTITPPQSGPRADVGTAGDLPGVEPVGEGVTLPAGESDTGTVPAGMAAHGAGTVPALDPPAPGATPPAVAEAGGKRVRSGGPRRWWPTVLCAVLAVIGFAGTGFFWRAWQSQRSTGGSTTQVRSTATGFVTALTNFDPGTVDSDFTRIQSYATGAFATQAQQFFGSSIRQQLTTAGAASRGQVRDLFVESMSGNEATVFVVVDQTYINGKLTSPVSDTLRLELGLTDGSSGWQVASVTVLQSPTGFSSAGTAPAP